MLKKFWHKLFGHKWHEMAFRIPADPEAGRALQLTQLIRRCDCGAVQSAQVLGDPIAAAQYVTTDKQSEELSALRRMAGLEG